MISFQGKTIVVTGAASGIGAALAKLIRENGGDVVGLDVQTGEFVKHKLDLSDPASRAEIGALVSGPIHGLANVAGVPGTAPVDLIGRVNLFGMRVMTELFASRFVDGASIVSVSSISADKCYWSDTNLVRLALSDEDAGMALLAQKAKDGTDAYQICKAALNQLVGLWAEQFAPQRIRSNAVNPGPVQTPILKDFETSMGKDRIDAAAAIVGRHALAEEIAAACVMLLSDQAGWINGQIIKVDGGLHARRSAQKLREGVTCN